VRRTALAVLVAWTLAAAVAAAVEERVFQLRFRSASNALAVVEPLLSPAGTVLLQPRANTLVVRDDRKVIDKAALALALWDQAPFTYRVRVKLYVASTAKDTGSVASDPAPELGAEFAQLFHFTSYQALDDLEFVSQEGSSVEASAGERYILRFTLRTQPGDPERVVLGPFELTRRHGNATPAPARPLLRSTVSLRVGQTAVVAAARSEQASRVLLLVVTASRRARTDGVRGPAGHPGRGRRRAAHRAASAEALRRELEAKGLHVFALNPTRGRVQLASLLRRDRISSLEFLVFNQQLATLLNAGIPVLQSLELMQKAQTNPYFRDVLAGSLGTSAPAWRSPRPSGRRGSCSRAFTPPR